ncbi:MAG: hypothetical protein K6G44_03305 [Lentisphaeria bacterium]|nr:hypothetical protein [Lentisphaeria bacterium]
MKDRFTSFLFIWLFVFIVLFSLPHGACADGGMSGNLNTRGQAPVAVIDSLTAVTNHLYSIISKKDNPGSKQSVCVEAYRRSAVFGINDIPAGSATVTASLKNTSPEAVAQMKWYVNGIAVQTGGVTYTFSAAGQNRGKYKIEARLLGSVKALNIYVVNCSYIVAVQSTSANIPIEISVDAGIKGNLVGHASWRLDIWPNEAISTKLFIIETVSAFANEYIGFHANNRTTVATTGLASEPLPDFKIPDSINPTRIKEYPVNIPTFLLMLKDTSSNYASPGNYRIGIYGLARSLGMLLFSWTQPDTRNCVTTALKIGNDHGLDHVLPNAPSSGFWFGTQNGVYIEYRGHAPCYLNAAL